MDRDRFTNSAKEYIKSLYIQHREDDMTAWAGLIEVLFDYVEHYTKISIEKHEKNCKD